LKMQRRSLLLDANLKCSDLSVARDMQVFLGDSLGEMYFYQALADIVTVCGSFNQGGSHNVIEPLALLKPVIVGPSVWGIEYPGQEALAAGVLKKVTNAQELPEHWAAWFSQTDAREQAKQLAIEFMRAHAGSVERHWLQLSPWLKSHE
jgi:3-deoxy-D-manno-octulosonic-acid transferase